MTVHQARQWRTLRKASGADALHCGECYHFFKSKNLYNGGLGGGLP